MFSGDRPIPINHMALQAGPTFPHSGSETGLLVFSGNRLGKGRAVLFALYLGGTLRPLRAYTSRAFISLCESHFEVWKFFE